MLDYGPNWFDFRYDIFGEIPMSDNYEEAQQLLRKLMSLNVGGDEKTLRELYENIIVKDGGLRMSHKLPGSSFGSRILNALPKQFDDAKWAAQHDVTDLHQPAATRSIEDLQQFGKCMDHIRNGRSTIKQAGVGAFATRDLPAGTVITASPLHHVNQSFANIYSFRRANGTNEWVRVMDDVVGKQLVLNYCFSHRDSSIMLCPYGGGVNYINHNREAANVVIRWAENFSVLHNQTAVESGPFSMFSKRETAFLAFDYVATKDIAQDDELFLDYGNDWVKGTHDTPLNYCSSIIMH